MKIDKGYIERRQQRETRKAQALVKSGDPTRRILEAALRLSGLSAAGRRRALALRLERNTLFFQNLSAPLEGLRVLQISDPHYSEQRDHEFESGIQSLGANTPHDIAVLTGDYRNRSIGPHDGALAAMQALRPHLASRAIAILGNHDPIDMLEPLTRIGYEVLVNRTITVEHAGAALDILGIDDPSYYGMHDLEACLATCQTPHRLLLAHSPHIWREAEEAGIDAYLCGHTHGGQLCLPGGIALRSNIRAPKKMISGAWRSGSLSGYTSRGAGTSIIDARSFCPPELTLHTLTAMPV